jgi:hypothetical protein
MQVFLEILKVRPGLTHPGGTASVTTSSACHPLGYRIKVDTVTCHGRNFTRALLYTLNFHRLALLPCCKHKLEHLVKLFFTSSSIRVFWFSGFFWVLRSYLAPVGWIEHGDSLAVPNCLERTTSTFLGGTCSIVHSYIRAPAVHIEYAH